MPNTYSQWNFPDGSVITYLHNYSLQLSFGSEETNLKTITLYLRPNSPKVSVVKDTDVDENDNPIDIAFITGKTIGSEETSLNVFIYHDGNAEITYNIAYSIICTVKVSLQMAKKLITICLAIQNNNPLPSNNANAIRNNLVNPVNSNDPITNNNSNRNEPVNPVPIRNRNNSNNPTNLLGGKRSFLKAKKINKRLSNKYKKNIKVNKSKKVKKVKK